MITYDFHVHSLYSDGDFSLSDLAAAALKKGMRQLGFSDHSHTAVDESYCMKKEDYPRYKEEIARLKAQYAGQINLYCGIEQDLFSDVPAEGFDYVLGSVHYVESRGVYYPVDESPVHLETAIREGFGGDPYALAERYFEELTALPEQTGAMVIAHPDLLTKFNKDGCFFSEEEPRYRAAWQKAMDSLLTKGVLFECNSGAVYKGRCTRPYPSAEICRYIAERGGRFLFSSDSHCCDSLGFTAAEGTLPLARQLGGIPLLSITKL